MALSAGETRPAGNESPDIASPQPLHPAYAPTTATSYAPTPADTSTPDVQNMANVSPDTSPTPERRTQALLSTIWVCPRALFEVYRRVVLLSMPHYYEAKLLELRASEDVLAVMSKDADFTTGWTSLGAICGILVSVTGSMLQMPSVISSSLSTILMMFALLCSLEGLLASVACSNHVYSIRTETQARNWIEHACDTSTSIWWSLAALLSLPAVNVAWSVIFFILALSSLYACPEALCAMVDEMLARLSAVSEPLFVAAFLFFRTAYLAAVVLALRRLHLRCRTVTSESRDANAQELPPV